MKCDFCGKQARQRIFAPSGADAHICEGCLQLLHDGARLKDKCGFTWQLQAVTYRMTWLPGPTEVKGGKL